MKPERFSFRLSQTAGVLIVALTFTIFLTSAPPSWASAQTGVTVLITDESGRWTPQVEEEMYRTGISLPTAGEKPGASGEKTRSVWENAQPAGEKAQAASPLPSVTFVSPAEALDKKTFMALSADRRREMLRFPAALLASKRAPEIFSVEYLFLVKLFKADGKWIAEATAYHIPDGDIEYMGLKSDRDRRKAMDAVLAEIPSTIELMKETLVCPVVGSDVGKIYHSKGADHMTGKGTKQEFGNPRLAKKAGFRPCSICYPERAYYTGSDSLEAALGRELTSIIESSYPISDNASLRERVQRIGQSIVKSCDLKDYTYRFRVLDTDIVNAYSVPAGGVYITRGLLELLESDDELGGIIAHEIAHTECHHGVKMYRRARNNAYLGTVLIIATGSPWTQFFASFVNSFFVSGWSRGFEAEADRQGIIMMSAAGLDPNEFVVIMKKLGDRSKLKKAGPEWFRTHPTDEQRLKEAGKTTLSLKSVLDAYHELEKIDPDTALYVRSHPLNYMDDPQYLKDFMRELPALRFSEPAAKKAEASPESGAPPPDRKESQPLNSEPENRALPNPQNRK